MTEASFITTNKLPLQPEHQIKYLQLQSEIESLLQQLLKSCPAQFEANTHVKVF